MRLVGVEIKKEKSGKQIDEEKKKEVEKRTKCLTGQLDAPCGE